jgi:hypothetical protein
MRNPLVFFLVGSIVGALAVGYYTYFLGDHQKLIETQVELKSVQQTTQKSVEVLQVKIKSSQDQIANLNSAKNSLMAQIEELKKAPPLTAAGISNKELAGYKSTLQHQISQRQQSKTTGSQNKIKFIR